ncbi:MAG: nucleotide sugar dehydrogenase [Acidimicrobiales bacterium]
MGRHITRHPAGRHLKSDSGSTIGSWYSFPERLGQEHQVSPKLVVVGLGYVGMPLAQEAVRAGLEVTGFDVARRTIDGLNEGRSHIDDLSDADIAEMRRRVHGNRRPGLHRHSRRRRDLRADAAEGGHHPDLRAVEASAATIASQLTPGTLVVLESTTYPGTTDDVVRPILEEGSGLDAGSDFALAYSPERIDPGNPKYGLRNTPKVVGGFTPACTQRAVDFYSLVVDEVVPTVGTREAELAKLLENTYRHVNIALVNEMAIFTHDLGIDLWAAIDAAKTKPFGFQAFYPGPGVGGHCIPIDPNYLSYAVRSLGYQFRFVELAQEVSGRMPAYVAARAQSLLNEHRKAVNGSKILLLGVTYKADISDERETPARPLVRRLRDMGAELTFFDPFVDRFDVDGTDLTQSHDLNAALAAADLTILLQPHSSILADADFAAAGLVLDTRRAARAQRRTSLEWLTSWSPRSSTDRRTPGYAIARSRRCWPTAGTSRTSPPGDTSPPVEGLRRVVVPAATGRRMAGGAAGRPPGAPATESHR